MIGAWAMNEWESIPDGYEVVTDQVVIRKKNTARVLVVEYTNPTQKLIDWFGEQCDFERENSSTQNVRVEDRPL